MEKTDTGQQERSTIAAGCCNCGVAHPSCLQHGGNGEARRQRQRTKRESLRDERTVSQILVRLSNPLQGGRNPRILETTGKLQILQQVEVPSAEKGNLNPSIKDSPVYVGMTPHAHRTENGKNEKEKKNGKTGMEESWEKKTKILVEKQRMDCYQLLPPEFMARK